VRSVYRGAITGRGRLALPRIPCHPGAFGGAETNFDFDTTVAPNTVLPALWAMEDVDGGGGTDPTYYFKTPGPNLDKNSPKATLTGATYGGQSIQGADTVNIVPKK
jgi:hypothetical protein